MDRAFVPVLKEHGLYDVPLSNSQTQSHIGRNREKNMEEKIYKFTVHMQEETEKYNLGWFGKIYDVDEYVCTFNVPENNLQKAKYELLGLKTVVHWDYEEAA